MVYFFNRRSYKTSMQTTYCVSCKKTQEIKTQKYLRQKNGRLQVKSFCSVCGKRKSRFVPNDQKGQGILSNFFGIRTPLSRIPGLNICFNYKTCKFTV